MNIRCKLLKPLVIALLAMGAHTAHAGSDVTITFTNLAPVGGVGVAPLWLGFHNGSFDVFNAGGAASTALERAAEDGNASVLDSSFTTQTPSGISTTLLGGPRFPGASSSITLHNVDLTGTNRYLNYAAMVVLSNDYFIGNDHAIDLGSLSHGGNLSLSLGGAGQVWDAGTEINNFKHSVANGAFGIGGGQSGTNIGEDEHGVVHTVTGNPYADFLNAEDLVPQNFNWAPLNFNNQQSIGRLDISVAAVPEPETYGMLLSGLAVLGVVLRRKRKVGQ